MPVGDNRRRTIWLNSGLLHGAFCVCCSFRPFLPCLPAVRARRQRRPHRSPRSSPPPSMRQRAVNPDAKGRASPIVVRVFELKSISAFNSADFFSLWDRERETLSAEMIGRDEFQLRPGEQKKFERTLQPDTRYVGVIAAFRDLERANWRGTASIVRQPEAADYHQARRTQRFHFGQVGLTSCASPRRREQTKRTRGRPCRGTARSFGPRGCSCSPSTCNSMTVTSSV